MDKYWFKPKKFGWGFRPISWQGWLATLVLLSLILLSAYLNNFFTPNPSLQNVFRFCLDFFIIIALSIFYFNSKTKGQLKWRWGK